MSASNNDSSSIYADEKEMSVSYIRANSEPFGVGAAIVGAVIGGVVGFLAVCFKQSVEFDRKGLESTDPPAPCIAKYNTVLMRLLLDFQMTLINNVSKSNKKEYINYIRNGIKKAEYIHVILESLIKKENIVFKDIYNANKAAETGLRYIAQAIKMLPDSTKTNANEKLNYIEGHLKDALDKISIIFNK